MTETRCPHCGNERERIPVGGGWSCAGCRAVFTHAPEFSSVHIHVATNPDGYGHQRFVAFWHEHSGRVRAQVFNTSLAHHQALWLHAGREARTTYAPGVNAQPSAS